MCIGGILFIMNNYHEQITKTFTVVSGEVSMNFSVTEYLRDPLRTIQAAEDSIKVTERLLEMLKGHKNSVIPKNKNN